MRSIRTFSSTTLLIFMGLSNLYAQDSLVESYIDRADSLVLKYPIEKVYLHLDKPAYSSGQDMWFRAYVTDGSNRPSMLSRILYVDLINPANKIVRALRLPLSAGLASGDIALPDTLKGGDYRLRAYTQWMRNFGEASFFEREIRITNTFSDQVATEKPDQPPGDIDLQFFPEGGQPVDSIPSKVAFKALGPDGMGMEISGYVEDSRKARVAEFKSEHAGMGTFMLTPFTGQKYYAVFTIDGKERRVELPASAASGYVLNLRGEDNINLLLRITGSKDIGLSQEVKILARSSIGTHEITSVKMARQFVDITVPKQDLPTGIVQLTLFSGNLPLAERLAFIHHDDQLELNLTTNKQSYQSREKVKFKLQASGNDDQPVTGSFSVAITDVGRVPEKLYEHSILSEFLVRSELKGYVENPDYYFGERNEEKQVHLDNLLLTQGWRRLGWKENPPELKFEAEKSITISGQVLVRNAPVEGGKVTLFSPDVIMSLDTLTDNKGRFNFDNLVFTDSTKFVVQARTEQEKSNVQIKLDNIPPQEITNLPLNKTIKTVTPEEQQILVKDTRDDLREMMNQGLLQRTNMLEEVVIKANPYSRIMKNSSKLGAAEADFVLKADKINGHPNLYHALLNKVPGLELTLNTYKNEASATLFRNGQSLGENGGMLVFLDGQNMGTNVNAIEPNAVAFIEVIRNSAKTAIYGHNGTQGVIIITTKVFAGIEDEPILESPRGIITYKPQGYTVTREFYSPNYNIKETRKDIKDLRSTIYWNPEVFTGKDKNPEFEFFTADRPGTYRAIVEGLDYKGRLGRKVVKFVVE